MILTSNTIRGLLRRYWQTKTKLREALPGVPDQTIDQLAVLMGEEGSIPTVSEGKPDKKRPRKASKKPDKKVNRQLVLDLATKIVGKGRKMSVASIQRGLAKRGQDVYLPYLGVMLSGSALFERHTDEYGRNATYSVKALALPEKAKTFRKGTKKPVKRISPKVAAKDPVVVPVG